VAVEVYWHEGAIGHWQTTSMLAALAAVSTDELKNYYPVARCAAYD